MMLLSVLGGLGGLELAVLELAVLGMPIAWPLREAFLAVRGY